MEAGVQCSLGSDQRSSLIRLEDRIIESQKHLFLKTDKILKFQNESIVKLTKLVNTQNETIGTLDARLEIIYRFLNKEIKDMEGRMMTKLDTISTSFTNQFVYSLPYALGPAMGVLDSIQKQIDGLCNREVLNSSNTAASDFGNTFSEARDPLNKNIVSTAGVDLDGEIGHAITPEQKDLIVLKSIINKPSSIDINVETKYAEVRDEPPDVTETFNNNDSEHAGLNFIYKSLGLPCETNQVCGNIDHEEEVNKVDEILEKEEVKLKRKHDDKVDVDEEASIVVGGDLEDGEILDDEQGTPVLPIGRVTVRTSGILKDEVMKSKKRKRSHR